MTRNQVLTVLKSHSFAAHVDGERIIAECEVVDIVTKRVFIEYGTFTPTAIGDYSVSELREWMGY